MNTIKCEVEVKVIDLKPVRDLVDLLDTAVMLLQGITSQTRTIGNSWLISRDNLVLKIDKAMDALAKEDE